MMSDPAKIPIDSSPATVPVSSVPVASFLQNISPPPPMYYAPPSIQAWSVPTVAPQWSFATIVPQNIDRSSPFFQAFLRGKPKALGILVICAAILEIALGIALIFATFAITVLSGITFWGPVFYIIAGSLTIAAQKKPNICLVKGSLSLNIISTIFSMTAVILNGIDLGIISCYLYGSYYNEHERCQRQLIGGYTLLSLLLVINLLLFCVTFSTSIFGCRSRSKVQKFPQVIVIQNDVVLSMNPGAVPVTATYGQSPQPLPPPPYPVNVVKATHSYIVT